MFLARLASGFLRVFQAGLCQNESDVLHTARLPRQVGAFAPFRHKTVSDVIALMPSVIFSKGFLGRGHVKVMKKITIKLPVSDFIKIVVL